MLDRGILIGVDGGWRHILRAWRGPTDLERRRVRCVFSQCLNDNALEVETGAPPGGPPGVESGERSWRAVARIFGSAVEDVVATVFPADCRVCDGPLAGKGFFPICDACVSRIQPQSMTLCERCGEALDMEVWQRPADGLLCAPCRQKLPEFERAVAYGVYAGELREMVHLLKFERMAGIARPLGQRLAEAIAQIESVAAKEMVVIPVPLYPVKERRRGYNQAVLLAEAAINELKRRNNGWSLKLERSWLRRVKDTESQFALTPRQRGLNLRGAFEVKNGGALKNREVLLVDDIYTTGATVRECALTLKHAGALKVWVATVARAQLEMVEMWNGD